MRRRRTRRRRRRRRRTCRELGAKGCDASCWGGALSHVAPITFVGSILLRAGLRRGVELPARERARENVQCRPHSVRGVSIDKRECARRAAAQREERARRHRRGDELKYPFQAVRRNRSRSSCGSSPTPIVVPPRPFVAPTIRAQRRCTDGPLPGAAAILAVPPVGRPHHRAGARPSSEQALECHHRRRFRQTPNGGDERCNNRCPCHRWQSAALEASASARRSGGCKSPLRPPSTSHGAAHATDSR